jgi:PTH1 family peptidyl-tRNA hydrolase
MANSSREPGRSPAPTPLVIPKLIVGLGNPGRQYEQTRHNVGFMAVDRLARAWQMSLTETKKFHGALGDGRGPHGDRILLLKPSTYMNRSGQSIRAVVDWYKLPPESVLVIYDEMDLEVGRLRLRLSGSAGGHNGMKSAIAHLGTQDFPRLRIGIGNPAFKTPDSNHGTVSHVLGKFSPAEDKVIADLLTLVQDSVELGLKQGIAKAMSLYNGRSLEMPSV